MWRSFEDLGGGMINFNQNFINSLSFTPLPLQRNRKNFEHNKNKIVVNYWSHLGYLKNNRSSSLSRAAHVDVHVPVHHHLVIIIILLKLQRTTVPLHMKLVQIKDFLTQIQEKISITYFKRKRSKIKSEFKPRIQIKFVNI